MVGTLGSQERLTAAPGPSLRPIQNSRAISYMDNDAKDGMNNVEIMLVGSCARPTLKHRFLLACICA